MCDLVFLMFDFSCVFCNVVVKIHLIYKIHVNDSQTFNAYMKAINEIKLSIISNFGFVISNGFVNYVILN